MVQVSEWRARARKHWDAGALDKAEDCLVMALEADPRPTERVWILLSLALLCRETERPEEAADYIEQAAEQERDPLALGVALYEGGDYALAASVLAETQKRRPGDAQVLRALGAARAAAGDLPGAIKAYEAAISHDINDHSLRLDLAQALHHAGELPRAANQLHILLQAEPKHAEARRLKAAIAYGLRQYREAASDYEALVRLGGAEPAVYETWAACHMQAGEKLQAARALAECTQAHPTHWRAYLLAARLFEEAEHYAQARRYYMAAGYVDKHRDEATSAQKRLAGREDASAKRPPTRPLHGSARLGPRLDPR